MWKGEEYPEEERRSRNRSLSGRHQGTEHAAGEGEKVTTKIRNMKRKTCFVWRHHIFSPGRLNELGDRGKLKKGSNLQESRLLQNRLT